MFYEFHIELYLNYKYFQNPNVMLWCFQIQNLKTCHKIKCILIIFAFTYIIIINTQNNRNKVKLNFRPNKIQIMNNEYQRLFGAPAGTNQNISTVNQADMLTMLLKNKKRKQSPPKLNKNQEQFQHQYLKMAETKVKKQIKISPYEAPIQKKSHKELKFQQEISRAKNHYKATKDQSKSQKKIYRPQVVDYFSNDKLKQKEPPKRQKQEKYIKHVQKQRERIKYRQQVIKANQRQRSRDSDKQRNSSKSRDRKQRERQRSRDKRQHDINGKNSDNYKDRTHQKEKYTQKQREKRQKQRQRQRKHRQHTSKYHQKSSKDHSHKKRHYQDEDSYQDDGFVQKEDDSKFDWKKQIRQLTNYDPTAKKYRQRDRQNIQQSNAGRMLAEDRFSAKYGRIQQEQDLRREMQEKRRKRERERERERR